MDDPTSGLPAANSKKRYVKKKRKPRKHVRKANKTKPSALSPRVKAASAASANSPRSQRRATSRRTAQIVRSQIKEICRCVYMLRLQI